MVATATLSVDDCVEAYEAARRRDGTVRIADHLPPPSDSLYSIVLAELVRVDMEYAWESGQPRSAASYLVEFPLLARDRERLGEVAYEEYRQRLDHGEQPNPEEYRHALGIDPSGWQNANRPASLADLSHDATEVLAELQRSDPAAVAPLLKALDGLPEVGEMFLGFRLERELGRGAFARVFLAGQAELANRQVALKVSAEFMSEPDTLARLQHTHIVPVYSVHRAGDLQAVVMPFYGATTLADVTGGLRRSNSLPHSGHHFVSTLHQRRDSTRINRDDTSKLPAPAVPMPVADDLLERLTNLSYIDAVLLLVSQVADALAHAHVRGIIHRDIKPANVLLTDDGRAMLLDFNLASSYRRPGARAGGTLLYMSPEAIEAFQEQPATVDSRSDIYSLGLVMWELLAGRQPHALGSGPASSGLACLRRQRAVTPPPLRPLNKEVSPAVESIVRTCLQPDPAKRYQSAAALRDDLLRQLEHRPLATAPEPSLVERGRKWLRRHPRFVTMAPIVALVAGLGLAAAGVALEAGRKAGRERAERWRLFEADKTDLLLAAVRAPRDGTAVTEGLAIGQRLLGRVDAMPLTNRDEQRSAGNALFAAACLAELDSRLQRDPTRLNAAVMFSDRAVDAYPPDAIPGTARRLREALHAKRDGRPGPATPAETTALDDAYLEAMRLYWSGQLRPALEAFRRVTDALPRDIPAWQMYANCLGELGQNRRAEAACSTCLALNPNQFETRFDRGVYRLRLKEYAAAKSDFDAALKVRPEHADTLFRRALCKQGLNDLAGARDDLTAALETGSPPTRALFVRSRVNAQLGDRLAAEADLAAGLKREPGDELSWVARGVAKVVRDPAGALADFEQARTLNPASREAWQNAASVLAEQLSRPAEALAALDRLLELHDGDVMALAGRGVLHARRGDRVKAVADAEACLRVDREPATLHAAASVYALLGDSDEALKLLAEALRGGYDPKLLTDDRDLASLKGNAAYERMIAGRRRPG